MAVNPRKIKTSTQGRISEEQQEAIKQLVMGRGRVLPKEHQAKAMITMWSALKAHFGCSYKDIQEECFSEALSLAARVPLEGELLPTSPYPQITDDYANRAEIIYYRDFKPFFYRVLQPGEVTLTPEDIKEWMEMRGLIFFTREELKNLTHWQWLALVE